RWATVGRPPPIGDTLPSTARDVSWLLTSRRFAKWGDSIPRRFSTLLPADSGLRASGLSPAWPAGPPAHWRNELQYSGKPSSPRWFYSGHPSRPLRRTRPKERENWNCIHVEIFQ